MFRAILPLLFALPLLAVHRKEIVFKNTPQGELKLTLFYPAQWKTGDRNPAALFFFGGGFRNGSAKQFFSHAAYLASRGIVAVSAEYRISSRHNTTPIESFEDCASAWIWIRDNAESQGIDRQRIAAGGGSAGATCAMNIHITNPTAKPPLLLLYNPVVDLGKALSEKSPANHLNPGMPPMIMFYGSEDQFYPPAKTYFRRSRDLKNPIDLYIAKGQRHGFFNDNPAGDYSWHASTMYMVDAFLARHGYLQGKPTITHPTGSRAILYSEAEPVPQPTTNLRQPPPGVKAERNIIYAAANGRNLFLDVYLPESKPDKPLPLIVWIHGGAWRAGGKDNPPVMGYPLLGYIAASIGYRYTQEAPFPANVEDCKAAIRWLRANAGKFGIDAERIGLWGSSAGGHLVAFLGTTGDLKEFEGSHGVQGVSSRVQAVVDWFGPTRVARMSHYPSRMDHDSPDSPEAQLVGALVQQNPVESERVNPARYVSKDNPPFLIQHGDADPLVPLEQSEILADALKRAGSPVELEVLEGAGHGGGKFNTPENLKRVQEFFDRVLKSKNSGATSR